jgi:hypothetical protein
MRVIGMWMPCDDGAVRPVIECLVTGSGARQVDEHFFVDSCADCTVLSADLLKRLGLTGKPSPSHLALKGISGAGSYVVVSTVVELMHAEGRPARIRGEMAAFTDPTATDFSILGRDVLDSFDVIISRRRNEVLLLAENHSYQVTG